MYDLLISGGTVVDPAQGLNHRRDLAIAGGHVRAVADRIDPAEAEHVLDASGLLVTPGLVDVHVHVYDGVSHYGVDADTYVLPSGVTTAIDAGSAGADHLRGPPPLRDRGFRDAPQGLSQHFHDRYGLAGRGRARGHPAHRRQ